MTTSRGGGYEGERPSVEAEVESVRETEDGLEVDVRMFNPLDRPIHYVADVRAIVFDPATRQLRVQLSDRGREPLPGGIAVQPRIRAIEPQSEVVANIRLPKTIVKLAKAQSPEGDVLFEEHTLTDAEEIEIKIGWADKPYYDDPREKGQGGPPIASWEQDEVRVTYNRRAESAT
jgi:hypothetical protein